jgi:hypothetical protein
MIRGELAGFRDGAYGSENAIVEGRVNKAVHHHPPLLPLIDETGADKKPERFRDRILGFLEYIDDFTGTKLDACINENAKRPEACRFSCCLKNFYRVLHICKYAPLGINCQAQNSTDRDLGFHPRKQGHMLLYSLGDDGRNRRAGAAQ